MPVSLSLAAARACWARRQGLLKIPRRCGIRRRSWPAPAGCVRWVGSMSIWRCGPACPACVTDLDAAVKCWRAVRHASGTRLHLSRAASAPPAVPALGGSRVASWRRPRSEKPASMARGRGAGRGGTRGARRRAAVARGSAQGAARGRCAAWARSARRSGCRRRCRWRCAGWSSPVASRRSLAGGASTASGTNGDASVVRYRSPLCPSETDRHIALARIFFAHHAPASDRELADWSGLTLGQVRAAIAALPDLVPVTIPGHAELAYALPDDLRAEPAPKGGNVPLHFLPFADNLLVILAGWRRCAIAPRHDRQVPLWGGRRAASAWAMRDMPRCAPSSWAASWSASGSSLRRLAALCTACLSRRRGLPGWRRPGCDRRQTTRGASCWKSWDTAAASA